LLQGDSFPEGQTRSVSLYYGLADGTGVVRYDNESGKGDHRHFRGEEKPYKFIDVETLVADFLADVEQVRKD